mmetsp:Transcript_16015/g.35098  ORF Transcript_16015/g.35098 Transcript_16015/m.35098 type:complete len:148 (-) Transcript_16015:145-588(-)
MLVSTSLIIALLPTFAALVIPEASISNQLGNKSPEVQLRSGAGSNEILSAENAGDLETKKLSLARVSASSRSGAALDSELVTASVAVVAIAEDMEAVAEETTRTIFSMWRSCPNLRYFLIGATLLVSVVFGFNRWWGDVAKLSMGSK